jgi:hypothetical protein
MARKGNAELTAHVHMVEKPEIVQILKDRAAELGVDVSVVYRWALREYAEKLKEGTAG